MSTVISAEIPDSLENRLTERQEPDESRSAAIRRTLRDGTHAPELRRENHELREKLENRENQIEELRDELDEHRERDARTITVTHPAAVSVIGWFLLALTITAEPALPIAVIGAVAIVGAVALGVYRHTRGDSA